MAHHFTVFHTSSGKIFIWIDLSLKIINKNNEIDRGKSTTQVPLFFDFGISILSDKFKAITVKLGAFE